MLEHNVSGHASTNQSGIKRLTNSDTHKDAAYSASEIREGVLIPLVGRHKDAMGSHAICNLSDSFNWILHLCEVDKRLRSHFQTKGSLFVRCVNHDWSQTHGFGKLDSLDAYTTATALDRQLDPFLWMSGD